MIQRLTNYNTNLPAAGKYHELRMADVLYVSWFLSIVETLLKIKNTPKCRNENILHNQICVNL